MIVSLVRFVVLGTLVMSIAFLLTRFYLGVSRRQELEDEWSNLSPENRPADREAWIDERLVGMRAKILVCAFLIAFGLPITVIGLTFITVNFY